MFERRVRILCPKCGTPMVFTNKITPPIGGLAGLIYRCPTRGNQNGCGYVKEVLSVFSGEKQELFIEQPVKNYSSDNFRIRNDVLTKQLHHLEV